MNYYLTQLFPVWGLLLLLYLRHYLTYIILRVASFQGISSFLIIAAAAFSIASCTQEEEYYDSNMHTLAESLTTRFAETGYTTYSYPSVDSIKSAPAVINQANRAWNMMLENSSANGRTEYGFYIYYNHSTKNIYCGEIVAGAFISGCAGTNGSISLGSNTNNLEVCGFYHCHTTLQYCPIDTFRQTGPSAPDISWANTHGIPGLVDDYDVQVLEGGMPKEASHSIKTIGPSRRAPFLVPN